MKSWVDEVVSKWKSEGVKINDAASIEEITSAEISLDFKFPVDFKELYLQIDGFQNLDWQEHMFHFWPLERIIEEYTESDSKNFIGFSDFLLASNFIGFNKNRKGVYKKYSKPYSDLEDGELIANSFEEVVATINSSNGLIY